MNANNFFRNAQGRQEERGSAAQSLSLQLLDSTSAVRSFSRFGPFALEQGKDKLFFYWNEEWYEQVAPEAARNIRVPTAAERNGDFSQTTDANGNRITIRQLPLTGQRSFPATSFRRAMVRPRAGHPQRVPPAERDAAIRPSTTPRPFPPSTRAARITSASTGTSPTARASWPATRTTPRSGCSPTAVSRATSTSRSRRSRSRARGETACSR